jgi:hypothetical protein
MAKFDFANEKTTIEAKRQKTGKNVKIVKLTSKKMSEVPERAGVFKPGRLIMNFAGENEGEPGVVLTHFNPPLELRVKFTKADQDRVSDPVKDLKMAFWSEDEDNWVLFTKDKHQYKVEMNNSGKGGTATAFITHWGDPQVAIGP